MSSVLLEPNRIATDKNVVNTGIILRQLVDRTSTCSRLVDSKPHDFSDTLMYNNDDNNDNNDDEQESANLYLGNRSNREFLLFKLITPTTMVCIICDQQS